MTETKLFSRSVAFADRIGAATLTLTDGKIAAMELDTQRSDAIDFGSDMLIPGLVELHTDHLEIHAMPRPHVTWPALSAVLAYDGQIAASGITTVFDSLRIGDDEGDRKPVSKHALSLAEAINEARKAGALRVEHLTHLRCEVCGWNVVDMLDAFLDAHKVDLISLMDHTPGQRQFRDISKFLLYYRGRTDMDAESQAFYDRKLALHQRVAATNRAELVKRVKGTAVAIASHDDATIDEVELARSDGVSIAEFPTTVEAARASHAHGIAVLMGAPNVVRGGSHSGNVAATELAKAGVLDILSSDYVPASLLMAAFELPLRAGIDLAAALRTVTKAPAEAAGLHDRGAIEVGRRADLVRVSVIGAQPVVREVMVAGKRVA